MDNILNHKPSIVKFYCQHCDEFTKHNDFGELEAQRYVCSICNTRDADIEKEKKDVNEP